MRNYSQMYQSSKNTIFAIFLSTIILIVVNLLVFNTWAYSRIFLADSAAGQVVLMVNAEKTRVNPEGVSKTAIVFGDSRLAEGFSGKLASELTRPNGLEVVNAAIPSTTPRCWYYFLKKIDPDKNNYQYVLLGLPSLYRVTNEDLFERVLDLDYIAPIISLNDIFDVASTFTSFDSKTNVVRMLTLKGFIYKYDVQDLLVRPMVRFKSIYSPYVSIGWSHNYEYPGRNESLGEVVWDAERKQALYPKDYPQEKLDFIKMYLKSLEESSNAQNVDYYRFWIDRIAKMYLGTKTKVIVFQAPAGPLPTTPEKADVFPAFQELVKTYAHLSIIPPSRFRSLESSELFFDYLHLNSTGRKRMTKELTEEILKQYRSDTDAL